MKRMWLLPLLALALFGADVTGKWSGNIQITDPSTGEKMDTAVKAEFAQKANQVSGSIGRAQDPEQEPIREGKLEGRNLSFEVRPSEAPGPIKFTLAMVGDDRLEGDIEGTMDAGKISGKVTLTRVK